MTREEIESLADGVRNSSISGNLVRLADVWQSTEAEFLDLLSGPDCRSLSDLVLVRREDETFVYSAKHMSRPYAEAAARASSATLLDLIAEAVRSDSTTYPRPTALNLLTCKPYSLTMESIESALKEMSGDPRYADIKLTRTSNGALYLFSSERLTPAYAASLAEWLAVGQLENP